MARLKNMLNGARKTALVFTVFSALVLSFAPARFFLLKNKAQTATFTLSSGGITVQSANLPSPSALVRGRALSFQKNAFTVEDLLTCFGAEVLESERVEGVTLYHAYAPCFGEGESLSCGRVNLQIAVGDTYLAVATPVFYGSF